MSLTQAVVNSRSEAVGLSAEVSFRRRQLNLRHVLGLLLRWIWPAFALGAAIGWLLSTGGISPAAAGVIGGAAALIALAATFFIDTLINTIQSWN